jgi:hypothetical protein
MDLKNQFKKNQHSAASVAVRVPMNACLVEWALLTQ